jgi:hypothetical protein
MAIFKEAHQFEFKPALSRPHALPGFAYYARRLGRTGAFYFTAASILISYPFFWKAATETLYPGMAAWPAYQMLPAERDAEVRQR